LESGSEKDPSQKKKRAINTEEQENNDRLKVVKKKMGVDVSHQGGKEKETN